jgi:hypothetical protein
MNGVSALTRVRSRVRLESGRSGKVTSASSGWARGNQSAPAEESRDKGYRRAAGPRRRKSQSITRRPNRSNKRSVVDRKANQVKEGLGRIKSPGTSLLAETNITTCRPSVKMDRRHILTELLKIPAGFHQNHRWVIVSLGTKRATVTIPDDLEKGSGQLRASSGSPPPLTAVVQAALREYLAERGYLRAATRPLRI